jgi:hypothetical protein
MNVLKVLLNKYRSIKKWYYQIYLYTDKRGILEGDIPFFTKLKWNLRGFTVENLVHFELGKNNWKDYISQAERNKLENVNHPFWADLLGTKVLFEKVFGGIINVPHIYWWSYGGNCYELSDGSRISSILEVINNINQKIILKPSSSAGGGTGVHVLEKVKGCYYIDSEVVDVENLASKLCGYDNYIAVEFVEQHAYAEMIYPKTTNSIRIVTVKNPDSGTIEVLYTMHRFGSNESFPVDNICNGGVFAVIDLKTGTMTPAKSTRHIGKIYTVHPDTNAKIAGTVVPYWDDVLACVIDWHKRMPQYDFLAWDVVITPSGKPYVLEINRGSDLDVQMIQPMRNEPLGKWMRKKGLL